MIIRLNEIPKEGKSIELTLPSKAIEFLSTDENLVGDIDFKGFIQLHSYGCYLSGTINGRWELICSRCLCKFSYEINHTFNNLFYNNFKRILSQNVIVDLKSSDLDVSELLNNEIDLRHVLLEQMILQIPIKPLCSESCSGLCPKCGQNLNIKKCTCYQEVQINPQFSKLQTLLKSLRKEK